MIVKGRVEGCTIGWSGEVGGGRLRPSHDDIMVVDSGCILFVVIVAKLLVLRCKCPLINVS